MTTPSLRFYFAMAAIAWLGACVYGVGTGGSPIGVVTLGWNGGVGDHLGYAILIGLAATSFAIGAITALLVDLMPVAAGGEPLPAAEAPANPSPWPIVGAFGAGVAAIGAVSNTAVLAAGGVILAATLVEWAVQTWADQATGDPEVNASIRSRLMSPVEVPAIGVLIIAFVALGTSRVLLAVSVEGAALLAIVLGVVVLAAAVLVASGKAGQNLTTGLLLVGAVVVLAGGVAGVSVGERDFQHHDEEEGDEAEEGEESSEGFVVNDPGDGVAPADEDVERTSPAQGNTPAQNTTSTVAAEEGE